MQTVRALVLVSDTPRKDGAVFSKDTVRAAVDSNKDLELIELEDGKLGAVMEMQVPDGTIPPADLDPTDVQLQEAYTPESVRFMREAVEPGTAQFGEVTDLAADYMRAMDFIDTFLKERLGPAFQAVVKSIMKWVEDDDEFFHGCRDRRFNPDALAEYIKKYAVEKHGAHFELQEPPK